ncbi:MAG: hypothetical protein HYS41_00085 [Candidatus Omnitrophica bacterium]|nr:hypothetical protein [Candidatus Omnitrophota bacterium]
MAVSLGLPGSSFALRAKVPAEVEGTLAGLEEKLLEEPPPGWFFSELKLPRDPDELKESLALRDLNELVQNVAYLLRKHPDWTLQAQAFAHTHYQLSPGSQLIPVESIEDIRQKPPRQQLAWVALNALLDPSVVHEEGSDGWGPKMSRRVFLRGTVGVVGASHHPTFLERALRTFVFGGYDPALKLTSPAAQAMWGNLKAYLNVRDLYHEGPNRPFRETYQAASAAWGRHLREHLGETLEPDPLVQKYLGKDKLFYELNIPEEILIEELMYRAKRSGASERLSQVVLSQVSDPRFTPSAVKGALKRHLEDEAVQHLSEFGLWHSEGVFPAPTESLAVKFLQAIQEPETRFFQLLPEFVRDDLDFSWRNMGGGGLSPSSLTPEGKRLRKQTLAYVRLLFKGKDFGLGDEWIKEALPGVEDSVDVVERFSYSPPEKRLQMLQELARAVRALRKLAKAAEQLSEAPPEPLSEKPPEVESGRSLSGGPLREEPEQPVRQEDQPQGVNKSEVVEPQPQEPDDATGMMEEVQQKLDQWLDNPDIKATIQTVVDLPGPTHLNKFFSAEFLEALRKLGFQEAHLLPLASLPQSDLQTALSIFVQEKWRVEVKGRFQSLVEQGRVSFTETLLEAQLVIGDDSVQLKPNQILLRVNDETARHVSPEVLTYLNHQGLLIQGTVLHLHRLYQGGTGEALLLFV